MENGARQAIGQVEGQNLLSRASKSVYIRRSAAWLGMAAEGSSGSVKGTLDRGSLRKWRIARPRLYHTRRPTHSVPFERVDALQALLACGGDS